MTLVSDYAKATKLPKKKPDHNLVNWWEEATNLPAGITHCKMNKQFCGSCPETPPCLSASPEELKLLIGSEGKTSVWPCELCTKEMRIKWNTTDEWIGSDHCCCWEKASRKRIIKYKKWLAKCNKDNILTVKRRKTYNKKRQKDSFDKQAKQTAARYSEGKICAVEECNNRITNRNTTGYCRKHTWLARK